MDFWKEIKALLCVTAAVGIWSILYPELVFHQDVCRVIEEEQEDDKKTVEMFLEADREKIRLKSKFWEEWLKWKKAH